MKPLIILGNGKSLKDFDLNTLSNEDTFGLNGAFIRFEELNWFPKYYGYFRQDDKYWEKEQIATFIENNYLKCDKFFCMSDFNILPNTIEYDRLQLIHSKSVDNLHIDGNKYSLPLFLDFDRAEQLLIIRYGDIVAKDKIMNFFTKNTFDKNLNHNGLYKLVEGIPLDDNDYIRLPRFRLECIVPKSFDHFTNSGGNSGLFACLVAHLMGYEKIILLGFDFNFVSKNDMVDNSETFWFNNYFNGKEYNIKDLCCCMTDEGLNRMQLQSFEVLRDMIEFNNLKLDIVNCTQGSKLDIFRKSTLEKEL